MAEPGDFSERRHAERLDILGALPGEIRVAHTMHVREIGSAGVQIETQTPLQVNSLHELRLMLGACVVVVRGRVVHCSISHVDQEQVVYRAGLEFVEPSSHAEREIAAYVELIREARIGE